MSHPDHLPLYLYVDITFECGKEFAIRIHEDDLRLLLVGCGPLVGVHRHSLEGSDHNGVYELMRREKVYIQPKTIALLQTSKEVRGRLINEDTM